jgi:hypothetical protein
MTTTASSAPATCGNAAASATDVPDGSGGAGVLERNSPRNLHPQPEPALRAVRLDKDSEESIPHAIKDQPTSNIATLVVRVLRVLTLGYAHDDPQ